MDHAETETQPHYVGTPGQNFCIWCVANWPMYRAMGGACELLNIAPLALRHDGPITVSAVLPDHIKNPLGSVHGGVSAMLLDEVGGLATCCLVGFRHLRGTRRLDLSFLKRANPGPVIVRAEVIKQDDSSVTVEIEVVQNDVSIARAEGIYALHPPGQTRNPDRARASA